MLCYWVGALAHVAVAALSLKCFRMLSKNIPKKTKQAKKEANFSDKQRLFFE